jgi:hypothetical protein
MMRRARGRGVALLLVLAALVVATTAAAGLSRAAISARLARESDARRQIADGLLGGAEAATLDWLHRHAGRLVLPPGVESPRFTMLDDRFAVAGRSCRVVVTAFDQCGMTPALARGTAGAALLPDDVRHALADARGAPGLANSLDLLACFIAGGRRAFPIADPGGPLSVGELVATHNPSGPGGTPTLNINTAPLPLVGAVYGALGRGGLDELTQARSAGRVSSPGQARSPVGSDDDAAPLPVAMSTCWAVRVDCHVDRLRRSWWCVYADTGSNWERVQRLAIGE